MESAPVSPANWTGHIIVASLRGIGLRIVEQLVGMGKQVVVIDENADDRSIRTIRSWRVPYIYGNARRRETLAEAGIVGASALISLDNNDLLSLELALLAKNLRPRLRVIVRMSNTPVGRAVEEVTGHGTVLDSAALAAPAFVDALLRRRDRAVVLSGVEFRIVELVARSEGSIRAVFGELTPVAVLPTGKPPAICPGRDMQVHAGDHVIVVATPAEFRTAGVGIGPKRPDPTAPGFSKQVRDEAHSGSVRALIRALFTGADRALKVTMIAVLVLMVLATVVIDLGYRTHSGQLMNPVDALYTTVQTVVTVGYGDFPFGNQPMWLVIFDIGLMLVGTSLMAVLFAQLTDLLISRRLASSLGEQRAARMRGHTIVVGLGSVGYRVVNDLLSAGQRVVVIERDPENRHLSSARAASAAVLIADATDPATLQLVSLEHATGAAVLTSDDLANIETGLAINAELADVEHNVPIVLRLFDRHLSRTVERSFGFREVRSTAELAAPWFVAAALGLDVLAAFAVERRMMLAGRVTVTAVGSLVGVRLKDLDARLRIIAVTRSSNPDHLVYPLHHDSTLQAGDRAYIIGPHEELLRFLERNYAATDRTPVAAAQTQSSAQPPSSARPPTQPPTSG